MRVLSLFDGISCGRVALERAGIPVECYYSSEIDKYAIKVAQAMYPDTVQIGDVCQIDFSDYIGKVDLIIGGSPCQDLSIAKQNRLGLRGERSGLFWKYVDALDIIRPRFFLLENVESMKNEDRDAITDTLKKLYPDTQCVMIDSALVSAQRRKRYYWTNWSVPQPEDKHIMLKDILESFAEPIEPSEFVVKKLKDIENKYGEIPQAFNPYNTKKIDDKSPTLTVQSASQTSSATVLMFEPINADNYFKSFQGGINNRMLNGKDKSNTLQAAMGTGGGNCPVMFEKVPRRDVPRDLLQTRTPDDKANTLLASAYKGSGNNGMTNIPVRIGTLPGLGKGQANRIYSVRGKSVCLNANGGGGGAKTGLYKIDLPDGDYYVRKLTVRECARLQTYPERCFDVANISNTQWYKAFGNGWTVDVIAHIFRYMSGGYTAPRKAEQMKMNLE